VGVQNNHKDQQFVLLVMAVGLEKMGESQEHSPSFTLGAELMDYDCPHLHEPMGKCPLPCVCGHKCKQHSWKDGVNGPEGDAWGCDVDGCACQMFADGDETVKKDILKQIAEFPGIDSEELAEDLGIDHGRASDLTAELVREGRLKSYSRMLGLPGDPNSTASMEL